MRVEIDRGQLANVQIMLGSVKNGAPRVISRSINKTLTGTRSAAKKEIVKHYNLTQKKVDEIKGEDPNVSESADFHLALGELALAQGQKDAGLAEIKKALEINPEHKEAAERLKQAEAQETASTEAAG